MLNRPDFVEAAPTLPGDPRLGLPPALFRRYDSGTMDGLSPPSETPAPRGAVTVGLPALISRPDSVGVPVFRMRETRPGWVSSLLRGGGVIPIAVTSATGACRFTAASPVAPLEHPIGGGLGLRSIRRFTRFTRPAFPLPAAPGWNEGPSASSLGFAPHSHP